uniref:FHA domain-containing protein n=1 Tax=Glossina morsitans morsitans TaxID=37546 RepID=A0A1B0FDQ0_GLOMM
MWFLKNTYTGNCFYFIADKIEYTVGRLDADLELVNDSSVSRAHAVFQLIVKTKNDVQLQLKDLGSKYGTFHNKDIEKNKRLNKDECLPLKATDRIRFGRFENVWEVKNHVLNVVISSLTKREQTDVEEILRYMGGQVYMEWSNTCTHLLMNGSSITIKLLYALLNQKPVITSNYLKDLLKAIRAKKVSLPDVEHYRPCFNEAFDLSRQPKRQTLLRGYTFIFLHRKHADMYGPLVQSAGATYKNLNAGVQKTLLLKSNVIVIEYTPSTETQSSQTIFSIADFLKSHGRRIIPEFEIGYAIIHCSTERYCNPCYISSAKIPLTLTENIPQTMTVDLTDDKGSQLVIPETDESLMNTNSCKPQSSVEGEPLLNMCITETPTEDSKVKRKHKDIDNNQGDDSDDENLLQFAKKMRNTIQKESEANKEEQNRQQNKEKSQNVSKNFLGKDKKISLQIKENINKTNKEATKAIRKRPLILALREDDDNDGDDDDLFNFGDKSTQSKQTTKKPRPDNNVSDDGLFNFKDKENCNESEFVCEDSNDLVPTQEFVTVSKKTTSKIIQLPKPKILPCKVNVSSWLCCSSSHVKVEQNNDDINSKTENEEDRKLADALKDAFQIYKISVDNFAKNQHHTHYKYKSATKSSCASPQNGVINFKKFVKKYQVPQAQPTRIRYSSKII